MSLRTLWSLMTVFLVAMVTVAMLVSIANIEKKAWHNSEQAQARLLIGLLSDELKMPMAAVSTPEVKQLIEMFRRHLPGISVYLRWANGETMKFGDGTIPAGVKALSALPAEPLAVAGQPKWYASGITFNRTHLGSIAVYFPGTSWRENDMQIKLHLSAMAAVIALLASLLVYGMSGRIVKQLRLLAAASKRVATGDFAVQLPIFSANEFGKAFYQFNKMVSRLEHREKVFDLYGRYQRPHLVADEYDRNTRLDDHLEREVSVVVVEMIDFDAYLQQNDHEQVIATLNRCFALFQQIVHAFGGHVDHVYGERLVAVFNHPFDLKCHENQAAKAAMAILAGCEKMAIKRADGGMIAFRAGMAIGEVVVGHLGIGRRKEFTIIGAPVGLATLLARLGDGTCVTAQYGTMLSLGHGFKQKDLGQQTLANGKQLRCINILPGEAYISQEIEAVVAKATVRAEPEDVLEDEGW
jgi:class 3 adenylate cyclase